MKADHHVMTLESKRYGPEQPRGTPDDYATSLYQQGLLDPSTLRHVTRMKKNPLHTSILRVSKRAALATKKQIWDSNDASIVAAQSAVDQWEEGYNALRGLLGLGLASASGIYNAAKAGATGLEHGFLQPVRDWILLPAFFGAEHVANETVGFLQSDECRNLERRGLDLIRQVPFVGESILAPAVYGGAEIMKRTWEIAQYPIPSPSQVRDCTEFVMTGTKWCIAKSSEEILLYVKRADANITRTLSHTQWKVLGSGPYATLDKLNKVEVLDHLCERYFSLQDLVARYELAAHIRAHNRPLYHDLVLTGLLRERGGKLTEEDEWLSSFPIYRESQSPFMLENEASANAFPLWFRLPYNNGKRPGRDVPWVQFEKPERMAIEHFYQQELIKRKEKEGTPTSGAERREPYEENHDVFTESQKYATNAKWYNPDLDRDLLLDQKRHAVSLFACCPKCRRRHIVPMETPLVPKQFGELCNACSEQPMEAPWVDSLLSPPPLLAVYRPTMWRFYGPGDELRRATWFLDTQRHGLQPYGEDAQTVLEDAYLFLKWATKQRVRDDSILLTVQVPSPDGSENQLVQFSSLSSATAIGKGLKSALSLFKRRVYRGINPSENSASSEGGINGSDSGEESKNQDEKSIADESISENNSSNQACLPNSAIWCEDKTIKTHPGCDIAEACSQTSETKAHAADEAMSLAYILEQTGDASKDEIGAEDDSDAVDHLVLIVHGIGEMLLNFDLFGISKVPTIDDCCGFLRKNHAEVLNVRFSQMYQTLDGIPQPRKGRVEYLPIEWHESFTIQSRRRLLGSTTPDRQRSTNYTINDVSLRTIPQLRQFANDTLMDVLYFMSPEHHDIIIDIVVNEMNFVVERFRRLTGFTGDVSVVGHSLGSIITWDILDNQIRHSGSASSSRSRNSSTVGSERPEAHCSPQCNSSVLAESLNGDPESVSPREEDFAKSHANVYPQLSFDVDNAFMLGSPIAVFLMIRNQRKPLSTEFTLNGCSRMFNIFHPYDPVAYRIEPLLDPRNAEIEPRIMTHWHGGFRFQYQTKRLWRKIVQQTLKTQESVIEGLESGFAALGLLDAANETDDSGDEEEEIDFSQVGERSNRAPHVEMGRLNHGQRIDYMLQEKGIENANEYVSALAAHSCYWLEKDLSLFIARQICLRALERETSDDNNSLSLYNSQ